MELRQLRYFTQLAGTQNLVRAAKLLNITPPHLTQQIDLLEESLAAKLVDRTSKQLELTAAGQAFLSHARAIVARMEEAQGHVARIHGGLEGRVKIGLAHSHFLGPFPKFVNEFTTLRPKVEVILHEMQPNDHLNALGDHRLDLCLERSPTPDAKVSVAVLWRDPVVVALPPGHRLAKRTRVNLADLRHENFVFLQRKGSAFAGRLYDACLHEGFAPQIVQEVSEIPAALNLVAAGLGITLAPASMALSRKDAVNLCTLVQSQISITPQQLSKGSSKVRPMAQLNGDVYAMWRSDDNNPALTEFRKNLLEWAHAQMVEL